MGNLKVDFGRNVLGRMLYVLRGGRATKLMAYIAFGDGCEPDPDSAAEDLRRAGYEVFRMPDQHPILAHPLDDHIECVIESSDDPKIINAIMNEIDGIVDQHGGMCIECGPIAADYVPFKQLFGDSFPLDATQ